MSHLFSPLTIRSLSFPNRLVVSPMCEYSSLDGFANDWHLVHLGSRAVGGAAIVFTEAAAVSAKGRITPQDLGIWKDEHIAFLKRITSFITAQGAVPGIQLAHAGRKASHSRPWEGGEALTDGAWITDAPSALPFKAGEPTPHELSIQEIQQVIKDFRAAAVRSLEAGFRIIEIHAAHGYLIHEFLSPVSNQRKDNYGGTFENRIRFLVEITEAIRQVWPESLPLFVRLSASEWVENGWQVEDSVRLSSLLKEKGVDLIDCSSGGNIPGVRIPLTPMYQTPFAEQIKKQSGILTGAVGLITTPEEAESIIAEGRADLVFLARQLLRDPYFPLHAAQKLGTDLKWPVQYERAKK